MNAKEYIKYLLSIENYSFSLDEIAKETAVSKLIKNTYDADATGIV